MYQEVINTSECVILLLDVNYRSESLKGIFRNYFSNHQELKYLKIISHALCSKYEANSLIDKIPEHLLKNRIFIGEVLRRFGSLIEHLDDFKNDRELALVAVKSSPQAYSFIGEELQGDREIVLTFLRGSSPYDLVCQLFSTYTEYRFDEEVLLASVEKRFSARHITFANSSLLSNKEFMMKAVKVNGNVIQYALDDLGTDEDLLLESVLTYPSIISGKYSRDPVFILKYIERSKKPAILEHVDMSIRKNRTVVWESVKKNPLELEYSSKYIRGNEREIVLYAVQRCGYLLEHVELPLSDDREIVKAAIQKHPLALRYASDMMKNDREIALLALSKNRHALTHISKKLQDELQYLTEKDTEKEWNFSIFSTYYWNEKLSLNQDRKYALEAIKCGISPSEINYYGIFGDRELMLEAVKRDANVLLRIKGSLDLNHSFVRQCIQDNKECLHNIRDHLILDKEFILDCCIHYSIQDFQ